MKRFLTIIACMLPLACGAVTTWFQYNTNVSANAAGTVVATNKFTPVLELARIRYASYTATNTSQCIIKSIHNQFTNQVANIQISSSLTNGVVAPDNTFFIMPGDLWTFGGLSNNVQFDLIFDFKTP